MVTGIHAYLYEIKMEISSDDTNFTTMVRHELMTVLALRQKKKHFEELVSTHENSIWQLVNAIPLCLLNFMSSYMILRVQHISIRFLQGTHCNWYNEMLEQ